MYLLTQFRAWWYYIGEFFAPVWMVADYGSYPLSTSVLDPRVLYAVTGWICVLALLLYAARRAPAITFLGLAFFVHLSPHSSFIPLAEMVNEHRPYLPLVGIFLMAVLGLFVLVRQLSLKPWVFAAVVFPEKLPVPRTTALPLTSRVALGCVFPMPTFPPDSKIVESPRRVLVIHMGM
jgi:hypothetical protein